MFKTGQKIGSYTLLEKLGRGGFGEVWQADWKTKFATTKVAVKLPLDEQVDHSLIEQEAQLWARASGHTNVLPIIEANEYDGQVVIVSEYAPDGSLEQLLKNHGGKLPIKQAVKMTIGMLNGLEFLHSRNIIHRDLKPANVLLQGETPRLADFGISRALQTTVASQTNNISGTFAYMSPEALDGKRSIQTDIWAVGVNLYRFLTGKLPFPQKEPSALFPAIIMRDYEALPESIPQDLKTVIAKSLAKIPEDRYQVAVEMRKDLRKIQRGENVFASVKRDLDKSIPDYVIPPTEKASMESVQNLQPETETVVRPVLTFGENEKPKSSNVWKLATVGLLLATIIGLSWFFINNISERLEKVGLNSNINKSENSHLDTQSERNANTSKNSQVVKTNAAVQEIKPTVAPTPTLLRTPRKPKEIRNTVKVYFEPAWINGRGVPLFDPDMTAILYTSKGNFNGKVNSRGRIIVGKVPCGENITIALPPTHGWEGRTVYHKRFIGCNKPSVNLGVLKIGSADDGF